MNRSPIKNDNDDSFVNDLTLRETKTAEDTSHVVHSMLSGEVKLEEAKLALFAAEEVEAMCRNSALIDENAEGCIPRFYREELIIGRVLGKGGYSTVNEISDVQLKLETGDTKHLTSKKNSFKNSKTDCEIGRRTSSQPMKDPVGEPIFDWDESDMMNQVYDRNLIAKHSMHGGNARYAIKKLHSSYDTNPKQHFNGIIDLAVEARFLAFIDHPSIVKMRAMSFTDPYKSGFFIVMDRLYDTLTVRIKIWASEHKQNKSCIKKIRGGNEANKTLWNTRIMVMYDIASALKYLHSLR